MFVHRSNRLERLADRLASALERPPAGADGVPVDVLVPEHVVVQSRGMAQWLQLELARRHGVSAHLKVWQPRAIVEHVLAAALDDDREAALRWARERVAWTLFRLLPAHVGRDPAFAPLGAWLVPGGAAEVADRPDDDAVARRWQLAGRIAHTFDQLAVFRPEIVTAWSAGHDAGPLGPSDAWQPLLWRALEGELGAHHVAARYARLVTLDAPARGAELPARLCVFGVTTLPPLHLDVLRRLGAWSEVRLFQLSPSREYWADVRSARERARERARVDLSFDGDALDDQGHPLLAALGRVGRDFQGVLEEIGYVDDDEDLYDEPGEGSALAVLQADVLALRARRSDGRAALAARDPSLQVLGCHSPVREVEVLRDALWARLQADPTLRPRDVVVLVPDVATYGPLVDAVFGVDPADPLHLPYVVADRPVAHGNEVARALVELFGLVGSRLAAPAVVELLAHGPIRRRFALDEADLARVEQLVAEAGVRWGRDAAHRASVGQPAVDSHTWRLGLDRLLLGHAVGPDAPSASWGGVPTVLGLVPWPDAEGEAADLIGRLVDAVHAVFDVVDDLATPRPPAAWIDRLDALVVDWFSTDPGHADDAEGADRLREGLATLRDEIVAVGVDEPVPLRVIRDLVSARLFEERREGAFLRQGVTFCEMLPMRSIPARVVGLLGMSDEAFPRADAPLGFDLLARARRAGDRSKRDDDRYLVLEALLSARDALIVTYVSRSVQDNKPRPPSVVLADLLDAVDATFEVAGHEAAREAVVVHHPLQPFSLRYVTEPAPGEPVLATLDPVAAAGARALTGRREPPRPFLVEAIPPERPVTEVDLVRLERFLLDPVTWFWEQRLGIGRVDDLDVLPDREPLELDGLDEHALGERMLRLRLDGVDWDACRAVLAGEGRLPLGHLANPVLAKVARRVEGILAAAGPRLAERRLPPVDVDLRLEAATPVGAGGGVVRLTGRVGDVREHGQLRVGYALGSAGRHRLSLWVRHLALQAAAGPAVSRAFGRDADRPVVLGFGPVDPREARAHLGRMVRAFVEGQAEPLRFLPDAAWAFVDATSVGEPGDVALRKARQAAARFWEHRDRSRAAWATLLGGESAFDRPPERPSEAGPFERWAGDLVLPVLRAGGGA